MRRLSSTLRVWEPAAEPGCAPWPAPGGGGCGGSYVVRDALVSGWDVTVLDGEAPAADTHAVRRGGPQVTLRNSAVIGTPADETAERVRIGDNLVDTAFESTVRRRAHCSSITVLAPVAGPLSLAGHSSPYRDCIYVAARGAGSTARCARTVSIDEARRELGWNPRQPTLVDGLAEQIKLETSYRGRPPARTRSASLRF